MQHWLPKSDYVLDLKNHFETYDQGYDQFSSQSVETIYVPLKEAK
jgi:predicted transcriptional regulator YdeE